MKVYEYLLTKKNHPSADIVYKSLSKEIPTLSKASVYNTMELLISKHLVQAITIEENETRFDADISLHGHFKCTSCGTVRDFHVNMADVKDDLPAGFTTDERHVYYKGLCRDCRYKLPAGSLKPNTE